MKGNVYGYVRVSTKEQNEGGQEAFRGAGYLSEMGSRQIKSSPCCAGGRERSAAGLTLRCLFAGDPLGKPVENTIKQPAGSDGVQRGGSVQTDSQNDCAGDSEHAGGDGKGAKGIKYRLPGIAGRIAYSDSADESQHGMKVCRQNEIEPQENERSYQIENASLLCPLYHILFKGKAHGHTGNSGPHGSWKSQKGCD